MVSFPFGIPGSSFRSSPPPNNRTKGLRFPWNRVRLESGRESGRTNGDRVSDVRRTSTLLIILPEIRLAGLTENLCCIESLAYIG